MTGPEIEFEEVRACPEHIDALFRLLNARVHTISHHSSVSYAEHRQFVEAHPYRVWLLVKRSDDYVGSFYLTDGNMVGVNVAEELIRSLLLPIVVYVKRNYQPLAAIPSVRSGQFAINVPPSNEQLVKALDGLGSELVQLTYYLPD